MKSDMQIQNRRDHKVNLVLGGLLISLVILAGACSSDTAKIGTLAKTVQSTTTPIEADADPLQKLADVIGEVQEVQRSQLPVIFNVELTAEGPKPEHLFVPSFRDVQIVLRGRTVVEMHYEVLGLKPDEINWISVPEDAVDREVGVSDEDHEAHHERDFVPWRKKSLSGIQPSGEEVHGYTTAGEIDVIRFSTGTLGTFDVVDPLHSEISARLTVY